MKMAVLLSGTGRTLDNFHKHITNGSMKGSIEVVLSNQKEAFGLVKARQYGYPAFAASNNDEINEILEQYQVDLVLLAGFLKLYTPPARLQKSVLNIHPSLIPSFCGPGFYGMKVHNAVYKRGVTITGCTVHFANEVYDEGPIVVQKSVAIEDKDTPNDIAVKVFESECLAFPEAINLVAEKGIDYFWNIRRQPKK